MAIYKDHNITISIKVRKKKLNCIDMSSFTFLCYTIWL